MGTGHTPLYRDMIDAIEHDREPVCSGIEGRKALELVLGIYDSAASGKPVRFPHSLAARRWIMLGGSDR